MLHQCQRPHLPDQGGRSGSGARLGMTQGLPFRKKKTICACSNDRRLIVDVTLDLHHAEVMGIARGNSPARARRGGASPTHLAVSAIPNAVSAKGGRPSLALHSLRVIGAEKMGSVCVDLACRT